MLTDGEKVDEQRDTITQSVMSSNLACVFEHKLKGNNAHVCNGESAEGGMIIRLPLQNLKQFLYGRPNCE